MPQLDAAGEPFDWIAALSQGAAPGLIDRPIWVDRRGDAPPLALRLVAVKKAPRAAAAPRRSLPPHSAARGAKKPAPAQAGGGRQLSQATLVAADWVVLVTALPQAGFSAADILALYRPRWRIELAFKRLTSLVGPKGPPASNARAAASSDICTSLPADANTKKCWQ